MKVMLAKIKEDIVNIVIPRVKAELPEDIQALFGDDIKYHINPTGKFVIGGPHGDTGLTGRKIIVDTYGGKGAHGGGAFSGKDPSKVDRSGCVCNASRCKELGRLRVYASKVLVQVSYAIGVVEPMGVFVDTYGTSKVDFSDGEIAAKVKELYDLRPGLIEQNLKLRQPMYSESAAYGHMGRKNEVVTKKFISADGQTVLEAEVELFTWEKLDYVDTFKGAFGL
jgi:S-adenosylmethionine synthetase